MTDLEKVPNEIESRLPDNPVWHKTSKLFEAYCAGENAMLEMGYRKVPSEEELRCYLVMRFLERIPSKGSYYDWEAQMLHQWLLERI